MPVTVLDVEYDHARQVEEAKNALGIIFMQFMENEGVFGDDCKLSAQLLSANLFSFKNPDFAEEKEVRCVHLVDVKISADHMRLVDAGGTTDGKPSAGVEVQFRIRDGGIVPFLDLPFPPRIAASVIKETYMGPANDNGPGNVLYLLGANGFRGVTLKHSSTTYR